MSGNFWRSSHYQQWLLTKQDLARERHADLQILSEEEYQKLMIFFCSFIQAHGEQLKVKQQVISSAMIYLKRFYIRNSFKSIDPLLLAPTCIYLSSKVEEFGVIGNSRLITACQQVVKNKFSFAWPQEYPYKSNHISECEFLLLEVMDCCLVLYHPYRNIVNYTQDWPTKESVISTAWTLANDCYRTDVCLLYPPHQIALACLHIACVVTQKDYKQWFAELNTDLEKIPEISRQIVALFDMWKAFDEKKEVPALLQKMPKPKTQPSRPPSRGPDGSASGQQKGPGPQGNNNFVKPH